MVEKFVSPFVPQQFPAFYKDQGPNFIAFIKAYYEWAEQTNLNDQASGFIGKARSIQDYLDLDSTQQQFVSHFRKTYVESLPASVAVDQSLLIKHILDLYRSKGTPRAYQLLFRILFNEDIDLYFPGHNVFKPSDNPWYVPKYIETTDSPYLSQLIGKSIYNSSGSAEAVVENLQQKIVNGKTINILYVSSLNGTFKYGEKILSTQVPQLTVANAPTIIGSLTAIAIEQGGLGFNPGDTLSVVGSGIEGKARVVSTVNQNGKVTFQLVNGGSGFSISCTNIVVATTYNLNLINTNGTFTPQDKLIDLTSGATGTITRANNSFIELINYSGTFSPGDSIASLLNINLKSSTGTFSVGNIVVDATTGANGKVYFANSSYVQLYNFSNSAFFFYGDTISNGAISATVDTVSGSGIGGNATIQTVLGGAGSGASFSIGGLINQELYSVNQDIISNYYNTVIDPAASSVGFNVNISGSTGAFTVGNTATSTANIVMIEGTNLTATYCANGEALSNSTFGISGLYVYDSEGSNGQVIIFATGTEANLTNAGLKSGTILLSNTSSSQIQITSVSPKQTVTANATIFSQNSSVLGVQFTSNVPHGYYIHGATVTDTQTGRTATVNNTVRTTDWGAFSGSSSGNNLDTKLYTALAFVNITTGTISFLSNINPGSGYTTNPYIDVKDTVVSSLMQSDGAGGIKGHNAVVTSNVLNANGIATAVKIIDSGFGYNPGETVQLVSSNGAIVISGASVSIDNGFGLGSWSSEKSFVSDTQKIQDSYYYQDYSYEIGAMRMFDTYESLVKSLVHPSGVALFGKYVYKDTQVEDTSSSMYLSVVQS